MIVSKGMEESAILIVDDQPVYRFGVRQILNQVFKPKQVFECSSGAEALEIMAKQQINYLFFACMSNTVKQSQQLEHVKSINPVVHILMSGDASKCPGIQELSKIGVEAFLPRTCRTEDIVEGMTALTKGKTYFLFSSDNSMGSPSEKTPSLITKREKQILKLIFQEHTNPEIAEMLSISRRTVDTHRKNLLKKLNVRNTAGLIRYALRSGLIQLDE